MTDLSWIGTSITAARPQAIAALLRYFRNLDSAEEAFQEASLRALKTWPVKGPPRNPAAWLILVGRNAGLDHVRRQAKQTVLPPEEQISDLEDAEADLADRLERPTGRRSTASMPRWNASSPQRSSRSIAPSPFQNCRVRRPRSI